jgi:hypothetical protein
MYRISNYIYIDYYYHYFNVFPLPSPRLPLFVLIHAVLAQKQRHEVGQRKLAVNGTPLRDHFGQTLHRAHLGLQVFSDEIALATRVEGVEKCVQPLGLGGQFAVHGGTEHLRL